MKTNQQKIECYYSGDGDIDFPYKVEGHKNQEFFSKKKLLQFCEEQGIKKIKPTLDGLIYEQKEDGWYQFYRDTDAIGEQLYKNDYKCTNEIIESICQSINNNPNTFLSKVVATKGNHSLHSEIKKGLDIAHVNFYSGLFFDIKNYETVIFIKLKKEDPTFLSFRMLDEVVASCQKKFTNCFLFEIDESAFAKFVELAPFTHSISSAHKLMD